ncbi:MAG: EAL domain-containing protein [Magnetococcales bacterium]|nr:EAL domain-containing protein [Magnetococcales bacterium]NGZ25392.1 EAL domain-containing protein [Magnetococcales bacterium]
MILQLAPGFRAETMHGDTVIYGDGGLVVATVRGVSGVQMGTLPGLLSPALFEDRFLHAMCQARRRKQAVGLMLLELNHMALTSITSLGLVKQEVLLQAVAKAIGMILRTTDSLVYLGGCRFALLLPDLQWGNEAIHNAGAIARKVFQTLRLPLAGLDVIISACGGITTWPQVDLPDHHNNQPKEIMGRAEMALVHAKQKGWNVYQVYTGERARSDSRKYQVEGGLRAAMNSYSGFSLYYQPQVELHGGRVIGAEALLRWQHPELGMVSPVEFIPVAEECGLIADIGSWVLRQACQQMATWQQMGLPPIRIGVNVSPTQFQLHDICHLVKQVLDETGIDPTFLDLEITESAVTQDVEKAISTLAKICEMGVRLSIDDFGTGHSSLSQLTRFPFGKIKIDRAFIKGISDSGSCRNSAILQGIIGMAHNLQQEVIAEGVETNDQLGVVRALGCNEMQGYLFSRPLPADEMVVLLRDGRKLE